MIGRAVFGSPITVGEAWALVKGRIWALLGLGALLGGAGLLILLVAGLLVFGAYAAAGAVAALLIGVLLFLLLVLAYLYVSTVLAFASTAIVLERMSVFDAIRRSFNLVRNDFWRVLGILLLTSLVVAFVAGAVGAPFAIIGSVVQAAVSSVGGLALSTVISHVGSAIGLIITQPFVAGVTVLLYTDRRIRAEAFDLVLRTGAASGPAAVASTDSLWLTRSA